MHMQRFWISAPLLLIPLILFFIAAGIGCTESAEESGRSGHAAFADIPLNRSDSTKFYKFDIRLPRIIRTNSVLRDTLTKLADAHQENFLSGAANDTMPDSYAHPWEMQLYVTIEDSTTQFITLLGKGYTYTGGAHGMPFYITMNYDQEKQKFISLNDLFADSTGLDPISKYIRRNLAQKLMTFRGAPVQGNASVDQFLREQGSWLKDGTAPIFSNYQNFLLQPKGIRFIFGAYQVGPYAIGTPEVEVPIAIFHDQLTLWGQNLLVPGQDD